MYMESTKIELMSTFAGKEGEATIENSLMDPVGEGESGMNGESSINIYILHV